MFCFGHAGSSWLRGFSSSCGEQGLLSICTAWALGHRGCVGSAAVAPGLYSTSSAIVMPRLSCSAASGIFSNQGSSLCLLHWQVDSLPLSYQGHPLTLCRTPTSWILDFGSILPFTFYLGPSSLFIYLYIFVIFLQLNFFFFNFKTFALSFCLSQHHASVSWMQHHLLPLRSLSCYTVSCFPHSSLPSSCFGFSLPFGGFPHMPGDILGYF